MKKFCKYAMYAAKWYAILNTSVWAYVGIAEWLYYCRTNKSAGVLNDLDDLLSIATDEWTYFLKMFNR